MSTGEDHEVEDKQSGIQGHSCRHLNHSNKRRCCSPQQCDQCLTQNGNEGKHIRQIKAFFKLMLNDNQLSTDKDHGVEDKQSGIQAESF